MTPGPAPGPGRDQDPARTRGPGDPLQDAAAGWRRLPAGADWMDADQWAARPIGEEPPDPDRYLDPEDPPLPGEVDLDAILAECRELTADQARAAAAMAQAGTTAAMAATAVKNCARLSEQTKAQLTREIIEHESSHGTCTQTFIKKVRKQVRPAPG